MIRSQQQPHQQPLIQHSGQMIYPHAHGGGGFYYPAASSYLPPPAVAAPMAMYQQYPSAMPPFGYGPPAMPPFSATAGYPTQQMAAFMQVIQFPRHLEPNKSH